MQYQSQLVWNHIAWKHSSNFDKAKETLARKRFDDSDWICYVRRNEHSDELWIGCRLPAFPPNIAEMDVTATFTVKWGYERTYKTSKRLKSREKNMEILSDIPFNVNWLREHVHEDNDTFISINTKIEITDTYWRGYNGWELMERGRERPTLLSLKQQDLLCSGYIRMHLAVDAYRIPIELNDIIKIYLAQCNWTSIPSDAISDLQKSQNKKETICFDRFILGELDPINRVYAQICIRKKKEMIKAYLSLSFPSNVASIKFVLTCVYKNTLEKKMVNLYTIERKNKENKFNGDWHCCFDKIDSAKEYIFHCDILCVEYRKESILHNYYKPIRMRSVSQHVWEKVYLDKMVDRVPNISELFNNGTWNVRVVERQRLVIQYGVGKRESNIYIGCGLIAPPHGIDELSVTVTFNYIVDYDEEQCVLNKRLNLHNDKELIISTHKNIGDVRTDWGCWTTIDIKTKVEIRRAWRSGPNGLQEISREEMQRCGIEIVPTQDQK